MKNKFNIPEYNLENASIVTIHKPFGDEYYFAVVTIDGRYPEAGKISRNSNRDEYIHVLEGEIQVMVNDESLDLKPDEQICVENGDTYSIEGKGKVIVFVKDGPSGQSEIINA